MGKSTAIFEHGAAANLPAKQDLSVYPRGFENDPEEETFPISNFDYMIPRIYTLLNLVYEFDDSNRASVLEDLVAGLEVTLSQYRPLVGGLYTDWATGKEKIVKKRGDSTRFIVKTLDDTYPDFGTLKAKSFDYTVLDFDKLLPADIINNPMMMAVSDEPTPVMILQVNFIRGGLILSVALHHRCSDGIGTQGFIRQWVANTQAIKTGVPFPPFDAIVIDKNPIISNATPSPERMSELDRSVPFLEYLKEQPKLEDFKITPKTPVQLHIPHSSITQLKADAQPRTNDGSWVSTYDALLALLWRAVTRARLPLFANPSDPKTTACIMGPINGRRYVRPSPLPPQLLGNVLALPRTVYEIADLTAPSGLPAVAAIIRASNRAHAHPKMFADAIEWVAGAEHKGLIMPRLPPSTGPMTMTYNTTWREMSYYSATDFGFGLPAAVRRPPPYIWPGIFMNPVRREDDGYDEFCLIVETECVERLREDEELMKYAHAI